MRLPEFAVVDVFNAFPDFGFARVLVPVGAEMAVVKAEHLRSEPRGNVNAVGDVADGNFVFVLAGNEAGPHSAGDFAMQRGDSVGAARKTEAENRHAESFLMIGGLFAAQAHQAFRREAEFVAQGTEMFFDEIGIEAVVAGGNGRVRGENDFARNTRHGGVERDAFFLHAGADGFEDDKAAVTFIQVHHAGADAHGFEGAETADAEQQFLADAGAGVTAVKARSEFAIVGRVGFNVGIEQEEIAAPDGDAPNFSVNGAAAGIDTNLDGTAVFADGDFQRKLVHVGDEIFFLLPAAAVEALAEISLAVEEADADEGNAEVGSAFNMVAGEHAEAAGIDRQRFMDAEFGGEIGDGRGAQHAGVARSPGAVGLQIFLQAAVGVVDAAVQNQFGRAGFELGQREFGEQRNGILIQLAPAERIEIAEKADGVMVPAPPKVASQSPKALLRGSDEAIESAGFADDGCDLRGGLAEHVNFFFVKDARVDGLNDQNALQDAAVDERNSEKRLVGVFAGFTKIFKARMVVGLLNRDRTDLFCDEAGEALVNGHAQLADALGAQADGGGEDEVGAVGLEQISGANLGLKALGDEGDDVHQSLGGLAFLSGEGGDLIEGENVRVGATCHCGRVRPRKRVCYRRS